MKDFTSRAIDLAAREGARYADIRIIETQQQTVSVKNGAIDGIGDQDSQGFGVRVLVGDSWGFASSAYLTAAEIDRVTSLAVEIARASAIVSGEPVDLGPPITSIGQYTTPIEIDPFTIPLEEKLDLLLRADAEMRRNAGVKVSEANVLAVRHRKYFANTEGAYLEQTIYESGGAIAATAVNDKEIQIRSYPNSFRYQGTGGWEYITKADLVGNAERVAEEAVALLTADVCPSKRTRCDPRQFAAGAADSRILRSSDRTRSRVRHRGGLCRTQFSDDGQAESLPVRLGDRESHRRQRSRDGSRNLRMGRRRRAGIEYAAGEERRIRRAT